MAGPLQLPILLIVVEILQHLASAQVADKAGAQNGEQNPSRSWNRRAGDAELTDGKVDRLWCAHGDTGDIAACGTIKTVVGGSRIAVDALKTAGFPTKELETMLASVEKAQGILDGLIRRTR